MRYCLFALLILASPAPTNAAEPTETGTRITLSAEAIADYPNDEAVIRFHVAAEGKDRTALYQQVNSTSHTIQRLLARHKEVHLTTINRRIIPLQHYDQARRQPISDGWRLVQASRAISRELGAISDRLAAIEKTGARLDSLTLQLSESAKRAADATLLTQAIAHFHSKAKTIASALGSSSFTILTMHTEASPSQPRPMAARTMMLESASAPAINHGESSRRILISGQILLPLRNISTQP
ncbi:MAG: SIMPL domain-containing protein [Mariprofundales bacterium]